MTEAEWLAASDPTPLTHFLARNLSDRKLRLFYCACSRRIWHLVGQEGYRKIVELSELMADGHVVWEELQAAEFAAYSQHGSQGLNPALWAASLCGISNDMLHPCDYENISFRHAAWAAAQASKKPEETLVLERVSQCALLRDIFGNPFRPIALNPSWLTSTVLPLANGIYEEKAFDRMPILADALQDAGCDNEDILHHCRQPGEHVRGCWVVDLLTGRK
jgi:hypothetical protein